MQRIFAENVPVLYFAAPRLFYGHSTRLRGVVPSVMRPQILWNADMLSVTDAAAGPPSAGCWLRRDPPTRDGALPRPAHHLCGPPRSRFVIGSAVSDAARAGRPHVGSSDRTRRARKWPRRAPASTSIVRCSTSGGCGPRAPRGSISANRSLYGGRWRHWCLTPRRTARRSA